MDSIQQSRLASVLAVLAGVWILVSPLFISLTGGALTSLLITGAIITLAGLVQLTWINSLPSWIGILAAVWLFISAFVFSVSTAAVWNEVVSAIVVFVLSTWDGVEVSQAHHQQHARG